MVVYLVSKNVCYFMSSIGGCEHVCVLFSPIVPGKLQVFIIKSLDIEFLEAGRIRAEIIAVYWFIL